MELFPPLSLELTTHHSRGIEFDVNSVHYMLFTRKIYLIGFLSVRVSNKNSFVSSWLKFVPLWQVIIHICLAAEWM